VFNELMFDLVPVKFDTSGIDPFDLEQKLVDNEKKNANKYSIPHQLTGGVLYCIPHFHNPTGVMISADRCKKVVQLARKHKLLVICDDVYNLLHFNTDNCAPKRLFAYDAKSDAEYVGNVVSNCSFSKYLSPGLRVGWLEMPMWIRQRFWMESPIIDSGGALNQYTCGLVASALQHGHVDKHLTHLRQQLKENCEAVVNVLNTNLPPECEFIVPKGGYFIWVKLPSHINTVELEKITAEKHGIKFQVGPSFSVNHSTNATSCFRICISYYEAKLLADSVKQICTEIQVLADKKK